MSRKMVLTSLILLVTVVCVMGGKGFPLENQDAIYFRIQDKVIEASIAREFETLRARGDSFYYPIYLHRAFSWGWVYDGQSSQVVDSYVFFASQLSSDHNVKLVKIDAGYEAHDAKSGENLNILDRRDDRTIQALVRHCNTLLQERGRIACEFDGGYYDVKIPFTTMLFNIAYLKYLSHQLVYKGGQYELIEESELNDPLAMYTLLKRSEIVRTLYNRLQSETFSLLHDGKRSYYELWRQYLEINLQVRIDWTETDFELTDLSTGERIDFPKDKDLIREALKELNYYREKVDFSEHFMVVNYPVYLLSILRLYDVNLQIDETTNEIIIVPGPTDPEAFFDIVAECTFVDDPSDTEYLKKHLTGWHGDAPKSNRG